MDLDGTGGAHPGKVILVRDQQNLLGPPESYNDLTNEKQKKSAKFFFAITTTPKRLKD